MGHQRPPERGPTPGVQVREEPGPEPADLDVLTADDRLLDSISAGSAGFPGVAGPAGFARSAGSAGSVGGAQDALTRVLTQWRTELAPERLPAPPSLGAADWALRRGRRGTVRPVVAAAAAMVVLLLGSAAVGSRTARPGDPLWPVASVLWSDRVDSAEAGRWVQNHLGQARSELSEGRLSGAGVALTEASSRLPLIQLRDGRAGLESSYRNLVDRVSARLATQSAPGGAARTIASAGRTSPPTVTSLARTTAVAGSRRSPDRPAGPASGTSAPAGSGRGVAATSGPAAATASTGRTPIPAPATPPAAPPTPPAAPPVLRTPAAPPVVLTPIGPIDGAPGAPVRSAEPEVPAPFTPPDETAITSAASGPPAASPAGPPAGSSAGDVPASDSPASGPVPPVGPPPGSAPTTPQPGGATDVPPPGPTSPTDPSSPGPTDSTGPSAPFTGAPFTGAPATDAPTTAAANAPEGPGTVAPALETRDPASGNDPTG